MNPNPLAPEKTSKKVSKACNTCRLKRKKCDGLDPCFFCSETKNECSYSREPRRRGPPSGYLRFTETRVLLLETLLGLFIARTSKLNISTLDILLDASKILRSESKTATQDVWDAYRSAWSSTESSNILDALANQFSPFSPRADQDTTSKALLPLPNSVPKTPKPGPPSPVAEQQQIWSNPEQSPSQYSYQLESFERTQPSSSSLYIPPPTPRSMKDDGSTSSADDTIYPNFSFPGGSGPSYPVAPPASPDQNLIMRPILPPTIDTEMNELPLDIPPDPNLSNYTGSYWRTADLALSEVSTSPRNDNPFLPAVDEFDLPPRHIVTDVLDVYYQHVHPSFPLLLPRSIVDEMLSRSPPSLSDGHTCLILALCAYAGRLSESSEPAAPMTMFGDTSKVAADLWYEQARNAASSIIRKSTQLESVQALLLLALRDHGKGNDSQAWILVGTAIRMGQELGLNKESSNARSAEEQELCRNVWGVSLILDLFLSLQLGRPPACADSIRSPQSIEFVRAPSSLFRQTCSLSQIVSRINFYFYLGFCPIGEGNTRALSLNQLKSDLDVWHQGLPQEFRISIGDQPVKGVLEVNMFYHVAVVLLYRPFFKDKAIRHATEVFLDAASTFNVLLEKYRNVVALSLCNPIMVYLIFTVAIAHLSAHKIRKASTETLSRSTTMALQTQLHLLNCLDALKMIGSTWELARRCCRTLDRLMEAEGMRPDSSPTPDGGLGKRKRQGDEFTVPFPFDDAFGHAGPSQPRRRKEGDYPASSSVSSPLYDPSIAAGFSSPQPDNSASLMDWTESTMGQMVPGNLGILGSDIFGPGMFSASWLSNLSAEVDSMDLGMMWDGDWDNDPNLAWSKSFSMAFDANS